MVLIASKGETFRSYVRGANFMTPEFVGYYKIAGGEVELTRGSFMGQPLWGVTVVHNGKHDHEASGCHFSEQVAKDYIGSLT